MKIWQGSIEDVLASGEYDQGDEALIDFDELCDLVEQARTFKNFLFSEFLGPQGSTEGVLKSTERLTNRPLHPVLGGKSPYTEFLSV